MKEGFYASIPAQRFLLWFAVVFAILFGIAYTGLIRFFPPPSATLSAEQVQLLYTEHNIRFRIGTMLGSLAGAFLIPLSLVISVQMARLERGVPIWSILQLCTGVVGTVVIWLPMIVWATAAFSADRAPEITLALHEFGWLMFIATLSVFPMQLIGVIVIAFTKDEDDRVSAFPRWLGYLTVWQLIQSFGGPLAMLFKEGIFSWTGLLPFWLPFSLFFFWMAAICFTILRALRHQRPGGASA